LVDNEIEYIVHFAAESHVDNSIDNSDPFIYTNINGTHNLLKCAVKYGKLKKFVHVSTDEVFGSLNHKELAFTVDSQYKPNSPYASSKAASDLIVISFNKTYGLPTIITNCSNNFGPRQNKEKMIPKCILSLKSSSPIPLYGNGSNIRDWIFVEDHVNALIETLFNGKSGKQYLIGGNNEISNFDLIHILAEEYNNIMNTNLSSGWFEFVEDRKGHDIRYSLTGNKARTKLGIEPVVDFEKGLTETIDWYVTNESWWRPLLKK
jgi:dTDP-glucose 4,6-dehydratase